VNHDLVQPITTCMKIIVTELILYPKQDNHAAAHTKRKPKNIDERKHPVFNQAPPGGLDMVSEHMDYFRSE
jgi:hypothetical protein